ncbi:MAG: TatD family hydrolase [Treponema sp.]|nr:TatD family hydrolase [Treponema sp.]
MLEKNENFCYFDAHFHLGDCLEQLRPFDKLRDPIPFGWTGCSCFHSPEEWNNALEQIGALRQAQGPQELRTQLYLSYGLHPQSAGWIDVKKCADFLEKLLLQNKLNAIGEAGFDYFTPEFRQHTALQEEMFNIQLELALQYNKPMVIHARKANNKLFEYSRQFKKLPAVLFHSFMGPAREAQSLINHGINAYFSFGKQIMNNNKKVLDCVQSLPLENLLLETDAPFQYLRGEKFTPPQDIKKVYDAFVELRKESTEIVFSKLKANFLKLYDNC